MPPRTTTPQGALRLSTYARLEEFAHKFAAGHFNLLLLIGGAGLAKSQSIRHAVGDDALWIEGSATAFGMYQALWEHRDRLIVIDDVDSLYSDKAAIRLLKCLCQTDSVKRVAWFSGAAGGTTGLQRGLFAPLLLGAKV